MASNVKIGTFTGTGAAINIELGWIPEHVEIVNVTDGDDKWEWYSSMPAASAIYHRAVTDNATSGNASMAKITANGVSAYSPTNLSSKKGFTVGSALSESAKVFAYKATRSAEY
jgi:hypothetical protein